MGWDGDRAGASVMVLERFGIQPAPTGEPHRMWRFLSGTGHVLTVNQMSSRNEARQLLDPTTTPQRHALGSSEAFGQQRKEVVQAWWSSVFQETASASATV